MFQTISPALEYCNINVKLAAAIVQPESETAAQVAAETWVPVHQSSPTVHSAHWCETRLSDSRPECD